MVKPRLSFVGPMIGRNPGQVTTQGEILADQFAAASYQVETVSDHPNRYVRFADITTTILKQGANIDIMMLQVYGGPSFVVEDIASQLGRLRRQRIVMTLRGGAFPEFITRYPNWTRRILRRAQKIVAPSAYLARAVATLGFDAVVIPNLIDLEQYPFRQRTTLRPRLLWMRSFHPVWNPQMAVNVLARLRQSVADATLVMAGQDKGLQRECQQLAAALGVSEAIQFPGFINNEQKRALANECDIFINTNRIDNMPVAVVEACAFGQIVIATNVGGIPDLLTDGETGLLVNDSEVNGMTAAILRVLQDAELAAKLSAQGRKLAEKSAWPAVHRAWHQVFDEITSA